MVGITILRLNVELLIFRNSKIANIEVRKDELFESFIFEFILLFFSKLFEHSKYLIIFQIWQFLKFVFFLIEKFQNFYHFPKLINYRSFWNLFDWKFLNFINLKIRKFLEFFKINGR